MFMKKIAFAILIVIISSAISSNLLAQEESSKINNAKDSTLKSYLNNFNQMHIGYYGSTQNCEAYEVYAFKYKRQWFLFVNTGENLSVLMINPPIKDKKIDYPSKYFVEGIAHSYALGYTRLVKKRRNVIDMNIYGYYKFNKFGKKVTKGLLFLEYPNHTKGSLQLKIEEKKAKKIEEEKAKLNIESSQLESIKTEINEIVPVEK